MKLPFFVGTRPETIKLSLLIKEETYNILENREYYDRIVKAVNSYGDGTALVKVRQVLALFN